MDRLGHNGRNGRTDNEKTKEGATVKQINDKTKNVSLRLPSTNGVDSEIIADCYIAALSRVHAQTPPTHALVAFFLAVSAAPWAIWYGATELLVLDAVEASLPATLLVAGAFSLVMLTLGITKILLFLRWSPYGYEIDHDIRARRSYLAFHIHVTTVFTSLIPVACVIANMLGATFSANRVLYFSIVVFTVGLGRPAIGMYRKREPKAKVALQPLDRTGTRLVAVSALIHDLSKNSDDIGFREVRTLVAELEILARDAAQFAVSRVPWWDRATRHAALQEGLRLAALIRAHKHCLVTAITGDDFEDVAKSLTGGAQAWANGDLAAMLHGSPDIRPARWGMSLLKRLAPALLLAVLGVVLPLVPPLSHIAQAGDSFRIAIFVAAALTLASSTSQTSDLVRTAVERTLFPRT
jgi:hypothetical protein